MLAPAAAHEHETSVQFSFSMIPYYVLVLQDLHENDCHRVDNFNEDHVCQNEDAAIYTDENGNECGIDFYHDDVLDYGKYKDFK